MKIQQIKTPPILYRKRVAAYARVSVIELENSLSAQMEYYRKVIECNPEWKFAGIYADNGISGTSTKRPEFKRLIKDCEAGLIDIILVKSISRFARNTVDTLNTIRHLIDLSVEVRFERERINTLSGDGELLLTLLASYAQEESDSISRNVKWAIRKRFKEGVQNGVRAPFAYRWDGEKYLAIPEKAEIVKEIFRRYIAGESAYRIANSLAKREIKGQAGLPIEQSTIKEVLSSRSYTGVQVLQKSFREGHKRRKNKGELPMYVVSDMYEPIISDEDFDRAQEIREERASLLPEKTQNPLRGKVKCGMCGRALSRKNKWFCNSQLHKGKGCSLIPVELGVFDETAEKIVVRNDYILTDGKKEMRTYPRTAFSGRLYHGDQKLTRDKWGGKRVWRCKGFYIYEEELRSNCRRALGRYYEQEIAQNYERVTINNEEIIFNEVMRCQRR